MNILKIVSGKVELRKDSGSLIRTIGNNDVINADINNDGSLVLVTTIQSKLCKEQEYWYPAKSLYFYLNFKIL